MTIEKSVRATKFKQHSNASTSDSPALDEAFMLEEDSSSQAHRKMRRIQRLQGFRPEIEGLRALAVLLVVLFHSGIARVSGGFVGVDVFFVISGFLITRLLLTELIVTGDISLPEFFLRRARRLLPALALVIVATLALARLLSPHVATGTAEDGIWASFYLINFHFLSAGLDYFALDLPDSPLLHLWSLAVEEQFYLFWPAALFFLTNVLRAGSLRIAGIVVGILGSASLLASIVSTASYPVEAYFLPFTRFWELFAGATLAIVPFRESQVFTRMAWIPAWAGLAAILYSALAFSRATEFPGAAALLPVVGTMAVIVCAPFSKNLCSFLSLPAMQWVGKRSYSIYLWHWPLLVLIAAAGTDRQSLLLSLIAVSCSIVLAAISYRVVEDPVRHAKRLKASRKLTLLLVALLTLGPALLAWWMISSPPEFSGDGAAAADFTMVNGEDRALERLNAALEDSLKIRDLPSNLTPPLDRKRDIGDRVESCQKDTMLGNLTSPECIYGDITSKTSVVLFGDSHAGHWLPAVQRIAEKRGWRVVLMFYGLCPSLAINPQQREAVFGKSGLKQCIQWRHHALQRIAIEKPAYIILSNYHGYCAQADCHAGLSSIVSLIREGYPRSRVLVFEDIPFRSLDPVQCLVANRKDIQKCSENRQTIDAQDRKEIASAVREAGAQWVQTTDWFCTNTSCPPTIGNVRIMADRGHMTEAMSLLLTPLVEKTLDLASDN